MRAEVRPIFVRGKEMPKSIREKEPAHRGALSIAENRLHAYGRVVTCAKLTSTSDGLDTSLLPELTDVQIIWLMESNMRLRGNEYVDGVLYGQTWDVKVL
jgi:hypothetical protein